MIKRIFICIALFGLLVENSSAQERLVNKANEKYKEYSFNPAIDIYKRVLDKGYVSADLLEKLGNSYYFNADYKEAAEVYKKLIDGFATDSTVGPDYYFRYGQSLKSLGNYDEANAILVKFTEMTSNNEVASDFKGERDYMAEIKENSGRYDIDDFEYNSVYSDFAPSFYRDGLIFSSDRDTGNLAKYRHTWNGKDFLDLYEVNVDSLSSGRVVKLGEDINTRFHESTSALTKDGDTLYFTRNNTKSGKVVKDDKGITRLKILLTTRVDGQWTLPRELSFNSDTYSVANPALSPDEKTMYFVSDMPGTLGESDIYKVSINEDGTYGTPENLGKNINTEARETFPFVTSKNILYFSSDGHPGLGGLDVFAVKIDKDDYSGTVLNVGESVNSNMDDFTFIFNEDTRKGFFASNRETGMGSDDIYSFLETRPLEFECNQPITGTVRDKITNQPLAGATVKVIDENNEEVATTITDSKGNYEIAVDCNKGNFVRASMDGYVPAEEYLGKSENKPRIIDFYLERDTVTAGYGDDLAKLLHLSTIYFDFDKYKIRPDAEIEIQKVIAAMEKYPSLKIQANSFTDSRGDDSYNLWLSQKRADATVDYMISKGIAPDRLVGKGYGETKLVNGCSNGVKCTPAEQQLNRRSEFIIFD